MKNNEYDTFCNGLIEILFIKNGCQVVGTMNKIPSLNIENQKLKQKNNFVIHEIIDEYSNEEFKKIFDKENTLILADDAGAGKSYACKAYDEEILFITPFNKLAIEIKKKTN